MAVKKKNSSNNKIMFRAGTRIGFAGAEDDHDFLSNCYVDVGQIAQAKNPDDPGSVLLGRTGSGKTATLLNLIENEEHVIRIDPQDLSLNYISNSNIISFFHGLGVNLDLFFQMLWRHVLVVELLNYHYHVRDRSDISGMLESIRNSIAPGRAQSIAMEYLNEHGTDFWEETEERIKSIVEGFETELSADLDLSSLGVPISAGGSEKVSGEVKSELVQNAKNVVNKVQIKKLSTVMDIMSESIFTNKQRRYYIIIDDLDGNWVDNELRYRLIRALIETIKSFRKLRTVKLIIALRSDLLERVYKYTRDDGFQEEKYKDFNIPIRWSTEQLERLIELRIQEVFRKQYTKDNVSFYDVFPERYRQKSSTMEYLISRTQLRPRDIIAFINQIFSVVAGKTKISSTDIDLSETQYSKERHEALCTEWQSEHPHLEQCIEAIRGMPTRFKIGDLNVGTLSRSILLLVEQAPSEDKMVEYAEGFMNEKIDVRRYRSELVKILFKVGAIGLRRFPKEKIIYSFTDESFSPTDSDVENSDSLYICPMLWKFLNNATSRRRGDIVGN